MKRFILNGNRFADISIYQRGTIEKKTAPYRVAERKVFRERTIEPNNQHLKEGWAEWMFH